MPIVLFTLKIVFFADCPFNEPHSQWWLHFVLRKFPCKVFPKWSFPGKDISAWIIPFFPFLFPTFFYTRNLSLFLRFSPVIFSSFFFIRHLSHFFFPLFYFSLSFRFFFPLSWSPIFIFHQGIFPISSFPRFFVLFLFYP